MSSRCVKRGFTLTELLVIMVIIAVLVAMLLPALNRAKEYSYRAQCQNNLRQMSIGVASYLADHDDWFPNFGHETWWRSPSPKDTTIWNPYGAYGDYFGAEGGAFRCRGAEKAPYQKFADFDSFPTYGFNRTVSPLEPDWAYVSMYPDRIAYRVTRITDHAGTFFFFDGNWRGVINGYQADPYIQGRFYWFAHHNDAMVSFLDGHVRPVSVHEWNGSRVDEDDGWCAAQAYYTLWE